MRLGLRAAVRTYFLKLLGLCTPGPHQVLTLAVPPPCVHYNWLAHTDSLRLSVSSCVPPRAH